MGVAEWGTRCVARGERIGHQRNLRRGDVREIDSRYTYQHRCKLSVAVDYLLL